MSKKPCPVVHFEMGYNDKDRMVKFYQDVFGWKPQPMGPSMNDYVVEQTTETDAQGMIKTPGHINGGFYAKTAAPDSHAPSVVISVDDIQAAMKQLVAAGGKINGGLDERGNRTMEPTQIPGVGLWISFNDTEGNRVSLLQPDPRG